MEQLLSHPDLPKKAKELSCKFTISLIRLFLGVLFGGVAVFLKEVIGLGDNTALAVSLILLMISYCLTIGLPQARVLRSPGKLLYGVPSMLIGYLLGIIVASQI